MKSPERPALSLLLGDRIDAVVGRECNIYFEPLSLRCLTEDWELAVTCEVGHQMADRWTFVPEEAHVGRHAFALSYRDPYDGQVQSASCELHVHAEPSWSRPLEWLPIGDSITDAGGYVEALAADSRLVTLGTRSLRSNPEVRHEGYPGWKYGDFLKERVLAEGANFYEAATSPFLFPSDTGEQFDFGRYQETHLAGKEPDFITLFLGANDIALLNDDTLESGITTAVQHGVSILDEILRTTGHTAIGIVTPLTPGSQDAFGMNYGCLIPRWRYRRNQHALVRAIQSRLATYHDRLSVLPAHLWIDPLSGYPSRTERLNAHTDETRVVAINAVHPSGSGHRQVADGIFSWMAGRNA